MEKIDDAEPINLGSDELISIQKLAEKIAEISGKQMEIKHDPAGPRGTHKYCADVTNMKKTLNWAPKISLDKGLRRTYEWAKGKLNVVR